MRTIDQGTQDRIAALARQGVTQARIAQQLGIGVGTVNRYVKAANTLTVPGADREPQQVLQLTEAESLALSQRNENVVVAAMLQQDSLKLRLLKAICEAGRIETVAELMEATKNGGPADNFGAHEVTHLLYSLNKDGLIKFRERKNSAVSTGSVLHKLEATPAGFARVGAKAPIRVVGGLRKSHARDVPLNREDRTDFRTHGQQAIRDAAVVTEAAQPSTNEDVAPVREWPLLKELRERAEAVAGLALRANALADAAAVLDGIDPEESERLLERAAELEARAGLSPLEREYLAFAEDRGSRT